MAAKRGERLKDKFETTKGILIVGKTAVNVYVPVQVDSDGKLVVTT